jgi:hypothetical protein
LTRSSARRMPVYFLEEVTMLSTDLRAHARVAMVVVLVGSVGCSFKDKGISVEGSDAGELGGAGGGGGIGGSVSDGSVADRFLSDGPVGGGDGPAGLDLGGDVPPPPPDVPTPPPDAPGQAIGSACASDGVCASGFCADKVCCEKRCGETCFSCAGLTNGATPGLCRPDVANTTCGSAMCSGSTHTAAPRCDGNGACVPRMPAACANNLTCASATACKTKCALDVDCTGGQVCDVASGACRPPGKAIGQACAAGTECSSGNCADKVCCDVACSGTCRACVMAQTGRPDGTCANVVAGTKDARCPTDACHDGTCGAGGTCRPLPDGTSCGSECCRGGAAGRICTFQCQGGTCNRQNPMISERCGQGPGNANCCCPGAGAGGAPACTTFLACPIGSCVQ